MHEVTIDRIEDTTAICEYGEGEWLQIPVSIMPDGVGEGDVVYVDVRRDPGEPRGPHTAARDILNELLSPS